MTEVDAPSRRSVVAWARAEWRWLFLAALAVSVVLKLLVLTSGYLGRLDADQAVLYLQARHVRDGELAATFWGQDYGGTLLQTLLGLVFLVTGAHLWLLPTAVLLTSTAVAVMTWAVGRRLGSPRGAAVAGALVALGPPSWLYLGVSSEGFYSVGLLLSLVALHIALHPGLTDGPLTWRRGLALGVVLGAALWESPFGAVTLLPVALLLAPRLRRAPGAVGWLLLGLLAGGYPLWLTFARTRSIPRGFRTDVPVGDRVEDALTGSWVWTFKRFAPTQVPDWLTDRLVVVGLLALVVVALRLLRHARSPGGWQAFALLSPVLVWVPFHVTNHLPSDAPSARYGAVLLPVVALWVGRHLRTGRQAVVVVLCFGLFSGAGIWQQVRQHPQGLDPRHNPSYARLAALLDGRGRTAVVADYWIAYRLAAETDERIVADPTAYSRYRPYRDRAALADRTTVVVFRDNRNDEALATVAPSLGLQRLEVEQFAVYLADTRVLLPKLKSTRDVDRPGVR